MERVAHFQSLLLHVSHIPQKQVLLIEKSRPSFEGPRKGASPPYSPKMGPPMGTDTHFQNLALHIV